MIGDALGSVPPEYSYPRVIADSSRCSKTPRMANSKPGWYTRTCRHMTPPIELYRVHTTALPSSVVQMDSIPTRRKGRKAERPRCAVRESVAAAGALPTPIDLGDRDDSGQMVETRRVVQWTRM